MKLALAQIDPTVGDLGGNRDLILARIEEARTAGADLVLLPELAVTGYPPEDLLLRPGFVHAAPEADAIVCIGSRDRKVTLPPTPKVIGGRRLASSDADPRGELTVNVRDIHTACSNQGFGRQTTRFY